MVSQALSEPQTMNEYLYPELAESSDDVQSDPELLPGQDGIQAEQSSEDSEQVAPDTDPEQPATTDADSEDVDAVSATPESVPVAQNWDSPENPLYEKAKAFEQIQQLAQQRQAEANTKAQRDSWMTGFSALAEADESDIPVLAGSLIEDIQQNAVGEYQREMAVREHGFNALIAGLETTLTPKQVEEVRTAAQAWQARGQTAQEIEQTFLIEQSTRKQFDAQMTDMKNQNKNLLAQLAAKTIQDSGVNRTETTAVGANGNDEPQSMLEYLTS